MDIEESSAEMRDTASRYRINEPECQEELPLDQKTGKMRSASDSQNTL